MEYVVSGLNDSARLVGLDSTLPYWCVHLLTRGRYKQECLRCVFVGLIGLDSLPHYWCVRISARGHYGKVHSLYCVL